MRKLSSLFVLSIVASCGGTSAPVITRNAPVLQSTELQAAPAIIPVVIDTGPDTSFGILLNDVRVANNAERVVHNAQLDAAAQAHAQDMLDQDYFSHTGLNGSTPGDRAISAGYDWQTYGENIASGYRSEPGVMKGWSDSPGHHANNINPDFEEFGLGLAQDGSNTRWVLMLGAR